MRVPTFPGRMPHCHRLVGRERGTTTVEFALVFPALVGVLFIMIDGGRLAGSRVMLSQATIAAARAACLESTTALADLTTAARDAAPMLAASISVPDCKKNGVTCTTLPLNAGDVVTVTANYTFNPGFFKFMAKTLTQKSRVVCE